jgi:hypothetical protein
MGFFKKNDNETKTLVPPMGYCLASNLLMKKSKKVGYMYREKPGKNEDSGWRFFSGEEDQEYSDNPNNFKIYDVNTIANYSPDIVPLINSPYGTAFGRDPDTGKLVKEEFHPLE